MRGILLGIVVFLYATNVWMTVAGWGQESDYWSKIEELSKKDTPQGNPELVKYLKSLTKEQLLTALRQYCKAMEGKTSVEMEWAEVTSMRILVCYAEPLKRSDVSDEEFRKMRRGKQRSLEAGLIPARFTKDAFEKVLAGLTDQKEGAYFRWTLAVLFSDDEYLFPALSKMQREQYFDACLAVATNRESPNTVRSGCLEALWKVFSRKYRHIIYEDDMVKILMGTGSPEEERNAKSLLDSGNIDLTSKTIEQLKPWRKRILDFRKKLVALLEDEHEPETIKKDARRHLHWLDRLPLINTNDAALESPNN